jgi:hypothetical protein
MGGVGTTRVLPVGSSELQWGDKDTVFFLYSPNISVFGVRREGKAIESPTLSHIMSALFPGVVLAPIPGLHIGGAVLYKAQRSGIFRPARITAGNREGLTASFPW